MNLDFPKEPYQLFTNIVDEKTFMIGDKTYVADEVIELTPEEKASLDEIREADAKLRKLRQDLINIIHTTDKTFIPEIQSMVHSMGFMGTALKVRIPLFVMGIAVRMGGRLPLTINQELTKITVRPRNTGESLNYTVATALDATMLTSLAEQRTLAFALANGDKTRTKIDGAVELDHQFQPVELDVSLSDDMLRNDVMPKFLKAHPYPMSITVILGSVGSHYSVINFASHSGGKQKQVDIESLRDYAHEKDTKDVIVIWPKMSPKRTGWTVMAARHTSNFDKDGKIDADNRTFAFEMNEKGELLNQSENKGFIVEGVDQSVLFSLVKNPNLK
jgi:hypothetical protein